MSTQGIDWGANIPLFSPEGEVHAIPQAQMQEALSGGGKRAVPMVSPEGTHHWVHEDEVQDAVGAGGRISFPSHDIPKWWGFTPGNVASNAWEGAKGLVGGAADLGKDLLSNPNWVEGSTSTLQTKVMAPMEEQVVKGGQELNQPGLGHKIAGAGHVLAGSIPLIGPWAGALGSQAGSGDVGGAAGQAAGALGAAKAPEVLPKALNRLVPSTTRAGKGISALEARHGTVPMEATRASSTLERFADELAATPSVKLHPLLEDFRQRMLTSDVAATHPEIAQQLAAQGMPTSNPLTFKEARSLLKRVNEAIPGAAKGIERNSLKSFADALAQDLGSTAQSAGFGKDYRAQTGEYRRGSKLIRAGDAAGPLVGAMAGGYLGRNAGALAASELAAGGAYVGKLAGKATVGRAVRGIIERDAGPPRLSAPPAVPPKAAAPAAPPAAEAPPLFERRNAAAERARIDAMSPEERHQELFVDKLTGLPNRRALEAAGPAPAYGFTDVAGLKALNDEFNMKAGDALLQAQAEAFRQAGLDSYRMGDSGDEVTHRGPSDDDLGSRLRRANEIFGKMQFEATGPDGTVYLIDGASFRHGLGKTQLEAQAAMNQAKLADKANPRGSQGTLRILPKPPLERVR